jgi:hypothetical protein
MESRELMAWCEWGLGSGSRLGRDGNMTGEQGVVGDTTFRDSDRDVARRGLGVTRTGMRRFSSMGTRTGRLGTGDDKGNEIVLENVQDIA